MLKLALILAFSPELRRLNEDSLLSVDCIHLIRKLLGTTSVCKRNKSDGVVRDAITDQSTQHARKFVSLAVDTWAHAHRYYSILPTCGHALNRSVNKWFSVNRGRIVPRSGSSKRSRTVLCKCKRAVKTHYTSEKYPPSEKRSPIRSKAIIKTTLQSVSKHSHRYIYLCIGC